jgi:hypothetical protein
MAATVRMHHVIDKWNTRGLQLCRAGGWVDNQHEGHIQPRLVVCAFDVNSVSCMRVCMHLDTSTT